ncbi:hypothetical protein D3C72_1475100 [compost metagenome]
MPRIAFVAIDDAPVVRPGLEHVLQFHRFGHVGQGQYAALLGGLDGVGAQFFGVVNLALNMLRHHRLQQAGAHFHRLLHHIIHAPDFQRCEKIMQVRCIRLRTCLLEGHENDLLAARKGKSRFPFAVTPVEQQDFRTVGHAQHIGEIVELFGCCLLRDAFGKIGFDIQALHPEISAHGIFRF